MRPRPRDRQSGDPPPLPAPAPNAQARDSLSPHGDELVHRDGARALSPGAAEQRPLPVERAATGLQQRAQRAGRQRLWSPTAAATAARSRRDFAAMLPADGRSSKPGSPARMSSAFPPNARRAFLLAHQGQQDVLVPLPLQVTGRQRGDGNSPRPAQHTVQRQAASGSPRSSVRVQQQLTTAAGREPTAETREGVRHDTESPGHRNVSSRARSGVCARVPSPHLQNAAPKERQHGHT